jgi:heme-degrading monooxygenase HmoA
MTDWHLAEVNVAHWKVHPDSPEAADFIKNLNRVNLLAERSNGFIWRLLDESGNPFGEDTIVTMSLWRSMPHLRDFVYRSYHRKILARREEWFSQLETAHMALWWVPAGHLPDLPEAQDRIQALDRNGPTAEAFTFRQPFDAPVIVA